MNSSILIDISQLRVGMYIQLDVGWLHHPFPVSSFRVASAEQIATLRELGLTEVRYVPKKSDPDLKELVPAAWSVPEMAAPPPTNALDPAAGTVAAAVDQEALRRRAVLDAQNRALAACNQRFTEATRQYQALERSVSERPDEARQKGEALVTGCVSDLLENGDSVIRLLSEGVGERNGLHPINVMVISLLLGRSLGMQSEELHHLGVAALVHDLGKLKLPPNLRQPTPSMIPMERSRYETHVGESVAFATRMGLPEPVVQAIAQHHEMVDGSGFPLRLTGPALGRNSQVLALVNRYDRMCNPAVGVDALTPHEALSVIFAQLKPKFDAVVLGAFIRMMGVYPPGSIVQLVNDRYAIVASVNSSRVRCGPRSSCTTRVCPRTRRPSWIWRLCRNWASAAASSPRNCRATRWNIFRPGSVSATFLSARSRPALTRRVREPPAIPCLAGRAARSCLAGR